MRFPKFPTDARALVAAGLVSSMVTVGCRLDMHDAPYYEPLEQSPLWENGQSSRTPVPGTVARGRFRADDIEFYTGRTAKGMPVAGLPESLQVDADLLERGRQKYDVFCSPCHGYTGYANGMIVQRGYPEPPSFHSKRLKEIQLGHFYDVITNGWGRMYSYAPSIRPEDRWAVAAYVRVLQLSQDYPTEELTPEQRAGLDGQGGEEHQGAGHGGGEH